MSGPRVWVDESDLRLVCLMARTNEESHTDDMCDAFLRIKMVLDPPPPPPLRSYRANMQGYGA